ncbi:N-acylglucosamine 2-epimerase, partial [Nonomuraea sp. NPDC004580]
RALMPRDTQAPLLTSRIEVSGPVEVAVVGAADDPRTAELHRAALLSDAPGLVVALGRPGGDGYPALLEGRGPVGGAPAAYVCRGFTCRMPVTTVEDLEAELAG